MIVLYFTCSTTIIREAIASPEDIANDVIDYKNLINISLMVFGGFGFLMTFIKTYQWSTIGYTFMSATWAIQIAILL